MQDFSPEQLPNILAQLSSQLPNGHALPSAPSGTGYLPNGSPMSPSGQVPAPPGFPSHVPQPAALLSAPYADRSPASPGLNPSFGVLPASPVNLPSLPQISANPPSPHSWGGDPYPDLTQQFLAAAQQVLQRTSIFQAATDSAPTSGTSDSASHNDRSYEGLERFVQSVNSRSTSRPAKPCLQGTRNVFHQGVPVDSIPSVTGPRAFDVAAIRRDFPILHQQVHNKQLVWFDNAATTQKPQSVIDAITNFYQRDNSNIHRAAHSLAARATDAFEQAREKVQQFIGAGSPKEIVFVRGTTEGINLVANTFGSKFLQSGDEIVLTTLEHHANIVPWQMVAKQTGAVIRVVPVSDRGEIMMEEYQRLLGPRTRIVAFPHANNSLGTLLPVAEMTHLAKRHGARVLIDGAQSVAHVPVSVQQLDCDFYVFSGHKIFGPTGIGAVFAKSDLLEIMPPWQGGGSMIKDVTFEETTYSAPPAKFEAGTPNIADAVGLGAALDYVNRLGLHNIARHEHDLLEYATERLSHIDGLRMFGSAREKVAVISFVLRNRPTEEIGRMLDAEGIAVRSGHHCAQPSLRRFGLESTVRPSFSLYNTRDEVDHLVDVVKRIQHR